MDIAVVILNYNGKDLLEQFLPSVVEHSKEANIYVIDNASNDGSVTFLNTEFPEIQIIQNPENYGYAQGYNAGLKEINEEVLCLLNSDIAVSEDWLKPILYKFENDESVGIIQPKILDYKNPEKFEYAGASGGFIDKYGFPFCRGRIFDVIEEDKGQYNSERVIFWASGACLFVRNSVFRKLGGFDLSFFAHMEEIDLCWRAFNQNINAIVVPESKVYHLGGGTLKYGSSKKTFLNFRNSLYMMVKNLPNNLFSTLFIRLALDGLAVAKMFISLKPNHAFAILKAHVYFYYYLPKYLRLRKKCENSSPYYHQKSIVWSHYVNKINRFDCL